MPPDSSAKARGKKRARQVMYSDEESSDTPSDIGSPNAPLASTSAVLPLTVPPLKKPKRAETRICPVCEEAIPIRLLAAHVVQETNRVEEIISQIGSTDVLVEPDDGNAPTRRSALRARKRMHSGVSHASGSTEPSSSELTIKTLRTIKRHRKQRHAKLRELTRDDEDDTVTRWARENDEGTLCPVCSKIVRGDVDVVEAHVDSCLAHARVQEEEMARSREEDLDVDGDVGGGIIERVTDETSFRGTGFDIRDRRQQDVDDEIDVDGEDEAIFGAPQFTEGDVLAPTTDLQPATANLPSPSNGEADSDVDIDADTAEDGQDAERRMGKTLQDLVAEGKVVVRRRVEEVRKTMEEVMGVGEAERVERMVHQARKQDDQSALVDALENKVKLLETIRISSSTSSLCRICLDPYNEPTVSTGCWHTCCRECWLRCLGSTKLCPICKRITSATDLRRIYL